MRKKWRGVALGGLSLAILSGCGGGGGDGSGSGTLPATAVVLSADQQTYEALELNGGASTLRWFMPFGGGNLVSGTNYFLADSTGGLVVSPSTGPQVETPRITTLDTALTLPASASDPDRYLNAGQVVLRLPTAPRRVSYVDGSVQIDYLSNDGATVLQTAQFRDFSLVTLSGLMDNTPAELLADYPIDDWIAANNFSATAQWMPGASYTKRQGGYLGDTYLAEDCPTQPNASATTGAVPMACSAGVLESAFPVTLFNDHPYETDFLADGTVSMVQGVRMWVANAPLASALFPTQAYRVYYELNGSVFAGLLHKAGTAFRYGHDDGTVTEFTLGLSQAAVSSVGQGIITGAAAGSQAGVSGYLSPTVDLFGIGGSGIDGSLSAADLNHHYNIPSGLDGSGQSIAIVDAPGTGDVADDLNTYSQANNLPQCNSSNPCFQHIDLSGGAAVASAADWGREVALDTQMVHAIAPGAKIILVTAASAKADDLVDAVSYAAALPGVTAVSMSFGLPEYALGSSVDFSFARYQSNQGLILFASTGDTGALNSKAVYPAASPYVTAVGGTRINAVNWVEGAPADVAWQFSSGGYAASNLYYAIAMPSWQQSVMSPTLIAANANSRAVPDVSAVADAKHSAVATYYKQAWSLSGGTSAGAPLWAGISALLAQHLTTEGMSMASLVQTTPGGFNGLLYQAASAQGTTGGLIDILSGSNNLGLGACAVCLALPGYDDVTGLGVPNVQQLLTRF